MMNHYPTRPVYIPKPSRITRNRSRYQSDYGLVLQIYRLSQEEQRRKVPRLPAGDRRITAMSQTNRKRRNMMEHAGGRFTALRKILSIVFAPLLFPFSRA